MCQVVCHSSLSVVINKESHRDLSISSLHYLSSRQGLANLVNFRTIMAEKMGLSDNLYLVFGGTFAGSLAVWLRIKYSQPFPAVVDSSASLLAKVDFYGEYMFN